LGQGLTDRSRAPLDLKTIKTILGYRHRPKYRRTKRSAEWEVSVERPAYDLTIFMLHCGKLTLKIQSAEIPGGEFSRPMRAKTRCNIRVLMYTMQFLEQMQGEHADLVILAAIANHFAAAGEEDEVVGAVPLFDDVEALVDLAAEVFAMKVPAQEDGSASSRLAARRHQANFVTLAENNSSNMMGAAARFHCDDAGRQARRELEHALALHAPPCHYFSCGIEPDDTALVLP
jgi:hypothetical protein